MPEHDKHKVKFVNSPYTSPALAAKPEPLLPTADEQAQRIQDQENKKNAERLRQSNADLSLKQSLAAEELASWHQQWHENYEIDIEAIKANPQYLAYCKEMKEQAEKMAGIEGYGSYLENRAYMMDIVGACYRLALVIDEGKIYSRMFKYLFIYNPVADQVVTGIKSKLIDLKAPKLNYSIAIHDGQLVTQVLVNLKPVSLEQKKCFDASLLAWLMDNGYQFELDATGDRYVVSKKNEPENILTVEAIVALNEQASFKAYIDKKLAVDATPQAYATPNPGAVPAF